MTPGMLEILNNVSLLDNAILIVDDIFDNSKLRNWSPCLYIEKWIQNALIQAELFKVEAIKQLEELMNKTKTQVVFQNEVYKKVFLFLKSVYLWENIGQELFKSQEKHELKIKKYYDMVTLFTGWHIKFWLEIGQLIANEKSTKEIWIISEKTWIIRQIIDDFDDYFEEHHEPFWDFINQSNRLPEILFSWNRKEILSLIWNKEYKQARLLVLNNQVRKALYKRCQSEYDMMKNLNTNFEVNLIVWDFQKILTKDIT